MLVEKPALSRKRRPGIRGYRALLAVLLLLLLMMLMMLMLMLVMVAIPGLSSTNGVHCRRVVVERVPRGVLQTHRVHERREGLDLLPERHVLVGRHERVGGRCRRRRRHVLVVRGMVAYSSGGGGCLSLSLGLGLARETCAEIDGLVDPEADGGL